MYNAYNKRLDSGYFVNDMRKRMNFLVSKNNVDIDEIIIDINIIINSKKSENEAIKYLGIVISAIMTSIGLTSLNKRYLIIFYSVLTPILFGSIVYLESRMIHRYEIIKNVLEKSNYK